MLVWVKGMLKKTVSVLQYCVLYYNGAQRYEQFLQVGRLYWASVLLGLGLCLPSASVSSVFMVRGAICILIFFAYVLFCTF